jgi:hypothetical protein
MTTYYTNMHMMPLEIPAEAIADCSHSGACDADVAFWAERIDFSGLDPENLKCELAEYGAWDAEELADHEMNCQRMLWLACGDIQENPEMY